VKQTIMSRLQEIYQSVPAWVKEDDDILRVIAHKITEELKRERRPGKV
jgi:hypothetical protein